MSTDMSHNRPPLKPALWSEDTLEEAIGELKRTESPESLRAFLEERIEEIPHTKGHAHLLARLHNELGLFWLQKEKMGKARMHLDTAVSLDPENLKAAYNRGNISLYEEEFEAALGRYENILEKEPDHGGATYNAALCHALTGRVAEALPLFERAVVLCPDYAGAHFWAGECLLHLEKPDVALPYFHKASALNPDHPESSRGLAICLFHAGRHEEAIYLCEHMLEAFGPELTALRVKGDALLALGNPVKAAQSHIDMALIDFDAREFLVNRARCLMETEPDKAPPYIRCVLDHFPDFKSALDPQEPLHKDRPHDGRSQSHAQ